MSDLLTRMERNRKEAEKFSLAKSASSPFLRAYYSRIAERYPSFEEEWNPPVRPPIPNRGKTRAASMTGPSDSLQKEALLRS
jgi:hypothetical protein